MNVSLPRILPPSGFWFVVSEPSRVEILRALNQLVFLIFSLASLDWPIGSKPRFTKIHRKLRDGVLMTGEVDDAGCRSTAAHTHGTYK
jgi:hypothetical protein